MEWIEDNESLATVCQKAQEQPAVFLDTEFVWERTYYAKLGLIQLCWAGSEVYLIDPLSITETGAFAQLLENPAVTKVFHEAASDVPILRRWCGNFCLPQVIFDTRIAAGFTGLSSSQSLSGLIEHFVGVVLAKSETRTDWLQRPLTDAQEEYAAEDVIYMPKVYEALMADLKALDNLAFLQEEMAVYGTEEYYMENPEEYARSHFSTYSLRPAWYANVVYELALWREKLACSKDIPRPRILNDMELKKLAELRPTVLADIFVRARLNKNKAIHYGNDILKAVARGLATPVEEESVVASSQESVASSMDKGVLNDRSHRLMNLANKRAAERKIDPSFVLTRKDADSCVIYAENHFRNPETAVPGKRFLKVRDSWRGKLLGDTFFNLIESNFN